MRSLRSRRTSGPPAAADDRTLRARVRDAAIELVAAEGLEALTARAVADRAGVSPGSVINNFGSMAGLREACDSHVAAIIRERKMQAMSAGASFDVVSALRQADGGPLLAYLAAVLAEDSPAVAHLVDELVADAQAYIEAGVASGMIRPSEDPRARAITLMMSSLGSLVMHRHLARLLGVDLTSPHLGPSELTAYAAPTYELYARGLFTPDLGERTLSALSDERADERPPPTAGSPHEPLPQTVTERTP